MELLTRKPETLLKVTLLLWVIFTCFKLCKLYQIAQNITYIYFGFLTVHSSI